LRRGIARARSQLQLTIIAYPMRAYQLRAATKSPAVTRLELFAFYSFSSTITSSPVCLPV
jgi:hypothetical protein